MKNVLLINTLRGVKKSPGRFIAIAAIIAISCAFYTGVKAACPDLKNAAWKYYDDYSLADIHLISTIGFNEGDIDEILKDDSFSKGYASYSVDLFGELGYGKAGVKVMSYSDDYPLNKLLLTEGRFPEKEGECIGDASAKNKMKMNIGDKITLTAEEDTEIEDFLSVTEYTIVGLAKSPMYISYDRGATPVGTGTLSAFLYVPEDNFTCEKYTDIYLYMDSAHTADIAPFSDEYDRAVAEGENVCENLSKTFLADREREIRTELEDSLADPRKELEDAEKELADGTKDYEMGLRLYTNTYNEWKAQKDELDSTGQDRVEGLAQLEESKVKLEKLYSTCSKIDKIVADYENTYEKVLPEHLLNTFKEYQEIYDENNVEANIADILAVYIITNPEKDPQAKEAARASIIGVNEQVREKSYDAVGKVYYQIGQIEDTTEQFGTAQMAMTEYEKALKEQKKELDKAKAELDDAQAKIDDAKAEIADAEKEAEDIIKDMEWYIWNRDEFNPGCMSFGLDAERVDSIAAVFPVFFIIIAALVCCTTMSRMVEEQRTETGTITALGFGSGVIILHYVMYAVTASVIGSVIGTVAGFPLLPNIIFKCYDSMYDYPFFEAPFMPEFALACIVVSVLCTGLTAAYTAAVELAIAPALLIRPKPPKSGKRILLERIGFIWKHMKFSSKVTFRNIFRYKSRFFMTLLGIGGCTALLLTGFGLKQAIVCIVDRQYDDIFLYDVMAIVSDKSEEEELSQIRDVMSGYPNITSSMMAVQESKNAFVGSKSYESVIFVPENEAVLSDYIVLMDRKSGQRFSLSDGSVIITEKLAKLLGVSAGDSINIEDASEPVYISAVTENYTFHYIYMNRNTYERLFGGKNCNVILMNIASLPDKAEREDFCSKLMSCDSVISASFTYDGTDNFRKLVSSLDLIVVALIAFSGALAFVILFNLANININERRMELATIKVLGFFDGEVASYIYRENLVSSFIAILLGLGGGIFFERFVVQTAEVNEVMFSRDIPWFCFALAFGFMAAFNIFVNIMLYFKLKGIDMASSMKAIE